MNNKRPVVLWVVVVMISLGLGSCSRVRSDAEITTDVQARIRADTALQAAPIAAQASRGVVVLTGSVASEAARIVAENDAKQAAGVKSVINNLQVARALAKPARGQPQQTAQADRGKQVTKFKPRVAETAKLAQDALPDSAPSAAPAAVTQTAQAEKAVPPVPTQVTIPEGTGLKIRLIDAVDTAKNKEGDTFRASLDAPIVIQQKTVIPKDADVETRLASAKSAGHFSGSSAVVLVVSKIAVGGKTYDVQTGQFTKVGASRGKRSAIIIGGGSALGAAIGALAGGGKGAAIGAAAGAGAGTGIQAMTKSEQVKLPSETLLEFQLNAPLTVTLPSEAPKGENPG